MSAQLQQVQQQRTEVDSAKEAMDGLEEGAAVYKSAGALMIQVKDVDALKVWLEAPLETRVNRVSGRDTKSTEAALADTQVREKSEWDRYYNIYHVDIRDLEVYNLVIKTQDRTPEEIADEIIKNFEEAQKGK